MFIVLEGPNGVGKTTTCEALLDEMRGLGIDVRSTAEPTRTSFGRAIRELDSSLSPRALALACAADRFDHLEREIIPLRASGIWIICDRYVPSSLVLQRIDGLDLNWIWSLNECAVPPDLTVYLEHDPTTIGARLDQRGRRSRFETAGSPAIELRFYAEARQFLAQHGWRQTVIDCREKTPGQIAAEIGRHIAAASSA